MIQHCFRPGDVLLPVCRPAVLCDCSESTCLVVSPSASTLSTRRLALPPCVCLHTRLGASPLSRLVWLCCTAWGLPRLSCVRLRGLCAVFWPGCSVSPHLSACDHGVTFNSCFRSPLPMLLSRCPTCLFFPPGARSLGCLVWFGSVLVCSIVLRLPVLRLPLLPRTPLVWVSMLLSPWLPVSPTPTLRRSVVWARMVVVLGAFRPSLLSSVFAQRLCPPVVYFCPLVNLLSGCCWFLSRPWGPLGCCAAERAVRPFCAR